MAFALTTREVWSSIHPGRWHYHGFSLSFPYQLVGPFFLFLLFLVWVCTSNEKMVFGSGLGPSFYYPFLFQSCVSSPMATWRFYCLRESSLFSGRWKNNLAWAWQRRLCCFPQNFRKVGCCSLLWGSWFFESGQSLRLESGTLAGRPYHSVSCLEMATMTDCG